jgi:ABC-type multidrug transport system ATPase subunit
MNILCGIYKQTSGQIKIYNYDTRDHMEYLRQLISYCPQRMSFFFYLNNKNKFIKR